MAKEFSLTKAEKSAIDGLGYRLSQLQAELNTVIAEAAVRCGVPEERFAFDPKKNMFVEKDPVAEAGKTA